MKLKVITGIMLTLLVISMLTLAFNIQPAEAGTIIVPDDYPTIQQAINAAVPGDTVYVKVGVYYENVVVNKTLWLVGEDRSTTIIDGDTETVVQVEANDVKITGFTMKNSGEPSYTCSIYVYQASGCNISYNTITGNSGNGIWLENSSYNNVEGNSINITGYIEIAAIMIWGSYNNISDNTVTAREGWGVMLMGSNNRLRGNNMTNSIFNFAVAPGWWLYPTELSDFVNDVDTSNTVDGKPVYYWVNKRDMTVPLDAGYVALINSTNITVKNLNLKNNGEGILLAYTKNVRITQSTMTANWVGVWLGNSSSNNVYGNTVAGWAGVRLSHSSLNNVYHNNITGGIDLSDSSNNNIYGNNMTSGMNAHSISLTSSPYNNIYSNNITNGGIRLRDSSYNNLCNNTVSGNNINWYGITIWSSFNNTVSGNNVTNHQEYGISLFDSTNNIIYHNNIINNTEQVYVTVGYTNVWDDGYPSGGNYWSDYTGVDVKSGPNQDQPGSDGIGDTPYVIDENNQDNYPLMYQLSPLDTDGDGTPDITDPDDDNDGINDDKDAFPIDPTEWTDTDGDGIGNNADADDDNDGVLDVNDAFPLDPTESVDTDGDGIGDNADTDDDNDGASDVDDAFPLDATESVDTDGDGVGNNADMDDDNDDINDDEDAFPLDPNETVDTDEDGIGNNADADDDNDGTLDVNDAFPLDPTESVDTDGDGVGDNSDVFPLDPNEWIDTDEDDIGNNADDDDDNDGMPDTWETENELNPLDAADASLDPDGDGLTNLQEYQGDTNPSVSDAQAFPWWILGVVAVVMVGVGATLVLWKRRRPTR